MSNRDLFISHSSKDAGAARELRGVLEGAGYTCWMAPDDVIGTDPWASQILTAIESSRAMLVLVSGASNASEHVPREVELANSRSRLVLPIRVEGVRPSGALEYHLTGRQRIDAFPPPIGRHRDLILDRIGASVPLVVEQPATAPDPAAIQPAAPVRTRATNEPQARGLSAWARANSMLAGVAVTLVALFVVGAAAMALSGPGATKTGAPASLAAVASQNPAATAGQGTPIPTTGVLSSGQPAPSRTRPAVAAAGAFPNGAEIDLFMSLPFFAARDIADCVRTDGELAGAIARIDCYAANGEHVFYTEWPDVETVRAAYRTELRVNFENPTGSCATSPAGDDAWSRNGQVGGRLACQLWQGGPSVTFYWTDEARRLSAEWFGSGNTVPEDDRALGYALFSAWIAE